MNESGVLNLAFCLFFFFFFFHVRAQVRPEADSNILHPLRPSITVIIGIFSVMISLTLLLLAYAKFCQSRPTNLSIDNAHLLHQNFQGLIRSRSRSSGIDRAVIESLPFFRFSSLRGSKEGLECAVCISKFDETDTLRLLPKCKHAFHMNCIDKWLEYHSSCPLCRHKFDASDLKSFSYTNSFRLLENPSNLSEDPNVELFVHREEDHHGSSRRFSIGNSFPNIDKGKEEILLVQQEGISREADHDQKLTHKFKHKIIVSDVVIKNRWSDVSPSDLMFLNSEMLGITSSKRFSSPESNKGNSLNNGLSMNEQIEKIKDDIGRKRAVESKFSRTDRNEPSVSNSRFSFVYNVSNSSKMSPDEKRSVSEITMFSRFRQFSGRNKVSVHGGKEERIRRLWLPIVRRTVLWFTGWQRNSQESENKRHIINV